jgi:hypothetical protein
MNQVYTYEARKTNSGRWEARQLLNGTLLKCVFRDTEEEAKRQCKKWEAQR